MKAFISYSHRDHAMLDLLHKHLAQLQRDRLITTWTDAEIPAGDVFDQDITSALQDADIFIALLSPDYIASNYCYHKEFEEAVQMQEKGRLIIIPVILEPCDWLHTPFKKFKALPRDGKAISTWENLNTAFLDVIQNIRKLVSASPDGEVPSPKPKAVFSPTRNYRVQRDFDSIQKLEFVEKSFREVKDYIKRYVKEVVQLENIKVRVLTDTDQTFECLLVNRNKINTEAQLTITIKEMDSHVPSFYQREGKGISYSIGGGKLVNQKTFQLSHDDYHLFWVVNNFFMGSTTTELESKEIADVIWKEWLESVGIL